MFVSDAWPAPATHHRPFCEHWPEGGSELLTSAPRSDFMAQSLLLSIDVCRGLGDSPLRIIIWLSFSQADLGPRSAQELFLGGFLKKMKLLFRRFVLIASGTEIFWRASFYKSWKTSSVSTTDWMVETQFCKLHGTSETFVGRAYRIFHIIWF